LKFKTNGSTLLLVVFLFLFLFPSISSAHAYILKSTPFENEVIGKAPDKVTIQFDEPIQKVFNSIQVFDSHGNRVDKKNGHINSKQPAILEAGLEKSLPNGTYQIEWKVISGDGHPVQGVIPFQIGTQATQQNQTVTYKQSKGYTPQLDLIIIRWVQYISNACFIGLFFFLLIVLPEEAAVNVSMTRLIVKLIRLSFLFLCLSILLSLPLQATIETSSSWNSVFTIQKLQDMIANTVFGQKWLVQIGILIILAIPTILLTTGKVKRIWLYCLSFALGIGLLMTKALTSHAASSTNKFLMVSLDFAHLLSASLWIGCLIGIVALLPMSRRVETKQLYMEIIRRFWKWGIIFVLLLALTGIISSLSYFPNFASLFHTAYGKVLCSKVILFIIMVLFAATNFIKGRKRKEKGLDFSLWGELSIGVIVLVLSVILTNLPTAMSSPGPFNQTKILNNSDKITLKVTPNVIGENLFEVTLKNKKGQPISNLDQVTLTFTALEMEMGKNTVILKKIEDGKYRDKGMSFNMAGNWNVHVHGLTRDLENIDTDFRCIVGSQ
jgi:copper transport protein